MDLKEEVKQHLIEQLNLEGMVPSDIDDDKPLFGESGLGLDSIDALEIIVLLDAQYGIALSSPEEGKQVFRSINSLVEYIESRKS
jgi:acyl carrier protein